MGRRAEQRQREEPGSVELFCLVRVRIAGSNKQSSRERQRKSIQEPGEQQLEEEHSAEVCAHMADNECHEGPKVVSVVAPQARPFIRRKRVMEDCFKERSKDRRKITERQQQQVQKGQLLTRRCRLSAQDGPAENVLKEREPKVASQYQTTRVPK